MSSPTPGGAPVPREEQPLDPRAIARRSLHASRNVSLWWVLAGVVGATVVALVVGTQAGAFALAVLTAACAVVRAVRPAPGPVALAVRARVLDVAVLVAFTVALVGLAAILPTR